MSTTNNSTVKGKVKVGDVAPDFTLQSQTGNMVSLKNFLGKRGIVLYFYPKDNTPGCTTEACSFRDSYEVFNEQTFFKKCKFMKMQPDIFQCKGSENSSQDVSDQIVPVFQVACIALMPFLTSYKHERMV